LFILINKSATLTTMSKLPNNIPSERSTPPEKPTNLRPSVPAPSHLPDSMMSSVGLLPVDKRLILFTRHSLRERSDGNGFASYQLPL